jgi:hypothetical protein
MRGVIFIGYAIETLLAEAPLHAASTPAAEAVLAAGTATMWVNPMRPWHVPPLSRDPRTRDSDCGDPHPFALNEDQVKASNGGQIKVPSYGRGCFTHNRCAKNEEEYWLAPSDLRSFSKRDAVIGVFWVTDHHGPKTCAPKGQVKGLSHGRPHIGCRV